MRRPRTALPTLIFAGLAVFGQGCAYFQDTPTLAPAQGEVVLNQDLPVPEGFELREDATLRHERTSFRRMRLAYRRPDYLSQERVLEFVKTAYPAKGWEVEFVTGIETAQVVLIKGSEECRITVFEDFGDAFTDMVVEVEPRQTPRGGMVARSTWKEGDAAIPEAPTLRGDAGVSSIAPATSDTNGETDPSIAGEPLDRSEGSK